MKNQLNTNKLAAAFEKMALATESVKEHCLDDINHQGFKLFVPGVTEQQVALASVLPMIGQYRVSSDQPKSALMCASQQTIEAIIKLNKAKDEFKLTVASINSAQEKTARAIKNQLMKLKRTELLSNALRSLDNSTIDLRTTYAHIQILPPNLESVSYTWATKHATYKKIKVSDAIKIANQMSDDKVKLAALIALENLPPNELLAEKIDTQPALKANLKYTDDNDQLIRKTIAVSGLLVVQDKSLPVHLWRDLPGEPASRLSRPKLIESTPCVPVMKLYRYV